MKSSNTCITLLVLSAGFLLVGCAARSPYVMTDKEIQTSALKLYVIERCVSEGKMAPETGGEGLRLVNSNKNGVRWPDERIRIEMARLEEKNGKSDLPAKFCNKVAMQIASEKPLPSTTPHIIEAAPAYNPPRQTYCNKIGNQVLCSSY